MVSTAVDTDKTSFLKNELFSLLKMLLPDVKGKWGVMNGQQMVEHLIEVFKIANGKLRLPLINKDETLEKYRVFLFSNKPFRENTKSPLLIDQPSPTIYPTMQAAIAGLENEVNDFFLAFEKNPSLSTTNPLFGELDLAANVQLLHKHALHHLRQFGLVD